ncbi:GPCR fungal pheromone mating factor, partial [Vararia minispora EC-137]
DPTYPLLPVASITSSALLLLLLTTNFIRQSWNLGVTFLSFWLFCELLTIGINAIIWTDNVDIKLYVYCDIISRLDVVTSVVKPASSFIITRRLYITVVRQSIGALSRREKFIDLVVEWGLGLFLPLLIAGPIYYFLQQARFIIVEGFGCANAVEGSSLQILLTESCKIVLPLISILFYTPKIVWTFYRHNKELNHFLHSNNRSVSLNRFIRALAIACLDSILILPVGLFGVVTIVLQWTQTFGPLPFYQGWLTVHTHLSSILVARYLDLIRPWQLMSFYFSRWASIFLGFVIFALFGFTQEARATYWRGICRIGKIFGWTP